MKTALRNKKRNHVIKIRNKETSNEKDKERVISAVDYYFLIHCCIVSALNSRQLGWNHADTTFDMWLKELGDISILINDNHLEDALYAANMMSEKRIYRHPLNIDFNMLLKRVLKSYEGFDKTLNVIYKKGKKK